MTKLIEIKIPDIGDVTDAEVIEILVSVGARFITNLGETLGDIRRLLL